MEGLANMVILAVGDNIGVALRDIKPRVRLPGEAALARKHQALALGVVLHLGTVGNLNRLAARFNLSALYPVASNPVATFFRSLHP